MERVAAAENYRVDTEVLQAREAGPAIINEAGEGEVDLILMGIAYKVRFGEFSLGEVVPYVLKNSPCRVILYQSSYTKPSTPYLNE
jgi:nucleotide-binding universal stress UspA family protein